jgi:hypothetical protein
MESDETTTDRAAAAADLAALRSDRAQLAERAMQPWWYDMALGLLVFGLVARYSLDNDAISIIASFVFIAAAAAAACLALALALAYRRITGSAAGGFRRGRTGGVLGIGIALASRWWSRVYIAELREGR